MPLFIPHKSQSATLLSILMKCVLFLFLLFGFQGILLHNAYAITNCMIFGKDWSRDRCISPNGAYAISTPRNLPLIDLVDLKSGKKEMISIPDGSYDAMPWQWISPTSISFIQLYDGPDYVQEYIYDISRNTIKRGIRIDLSPKISKADPAYQAIADKQKEMLDYVQRYNGVRKIREKDEIESQQRLESVRTLQKNLSDYYKQYRAYPLSGAGGTIEYDGRKYKYTPLTKKKKPCVKERECVSYSLAFSLIVDSGKFKKGNHILTPAGIR